MGRPKLKAEEKRNCRITVVLTKEELQAANDAAGSKGKTSSTWLRNVLRKELGLPEEE
jgi:predicted DNA binding CopG/RHH family protein